MSPSLNRARIALFALLGAILLPQSALAWKLSDEPAARDTVSIRVESDDQGTSYIARDYLTTGAACGSEINAWAAAYSDRSVFRGMEKAPKALRETVGLIRALNGGNDLELIHPGDILLFPTCKGRAAEARLKVAAWFSEKRHQSELSAAHAEILRLRQSLAREAAETASARVKVTEVQAQLVSGEAENVRLRAQNFSLAAENASLRSAADDYHVQAQALVRDRDALQAALVQARTEAADADTRANQAIAAARRDQQVVATLTQRNRALGAQLATLEANPGAQPISVAAYRDPQVAELMNAVTEQADMVARLGGEITALAAKVTGYQAQLQSLGAALSAATTRNEELTTRNTTLTMQKAQLEQSLTTTTNWRWFFVVLLGIVTFLLLLSLFWAPMPHWRRAQPRTA